MANRTDGFSDEPLRRYGAPDPQADGNDPDAIRRDIQRTRARMTGTVEEIGDRLNPDRLRTQFKQNLHDATIGKAEHMARDAADRVDDARHSMMDNVRDNPLPAAMVGIGLGWMFLNGRKREQYDDRLQYGPQTMPPPGYYTPRYDESHGERFDGARDRASEVGDQISNFGDRAKERGEQVGRQAQDRATEIAHDARDNISHAADRARSRAEDLTRQTRQSGERLEHRFEDTLNDAPLAVGAAAAAIGLAIGLSAPSTRRESELMGERRDQLVGRAQREFKDQARERVEQAADRIADGAHEAVDEVTDRAETAAEERLR